MDIAPIKTQRDYRRVLKEINGLMMAKRNTPEGDRVTLVEAWYAASPPPAANMVVYKGRKNHPLQAPSP